MKIGAVGDMSSEPSMEDILSSIKKIIAEDSTAALSPRVRPVPRLSTPKADAHPLTAPVLAAAALPVIEPIEEEEILELTADHAPDESDLVSEETLEDSRSAFGALVQPAEKPAVTGTDTIEGLVRDMLRPMLKEWLDTNLADIVKATVEREVARVSGRKL
jgi:uncharacterized protein